MDLKQSEETSSDLNTENDQSPWNPPQNPCVLGINPLPNGEVEISGPPEEVEALKKFIIKTLFGENYVDCSINQIEFTQSINNFSN